MTMRLKRENHHVIGDLLWNKVGNFPFWPCMVSYDPNIGLYTKLRKVRKRDERIYHVQYFGKQVQHGWTTPCSTFPFEGENKFHSRKEELLKKVSTESDKKKVESKYNVPSSIQKSWLIAVKEAERALAVNPHDRFETFVFKYEYPKKLAYNGMKHKKLAVNGMKHRKASPYGIKHYKKLTRNGSKKRRSKKKKTLEKLDPTKKLSNSTDANICRLCEGENIDVTCAGVCRQAFHKSCLGLLQVPEGFKCLDCDRGLVTCCVCKKPNNYIMKCSKCSNHYHEECIENFESANIKKKICPAHFCLSCSNENAKNLTLKAPLVRCFRCPSIFHAKSRCFPAGSVQLTTTVMVCPEHFLGKNKLSPQPTFNVPYCIVCSEGGNLICCESCPNSYHSKCLDQKVPPGDFFCESCSKKYYLFSGTIVWAKTGSFRWWPAEVMNPKDLPAGPRDITTHHGEFPVQYFGTYEFYWTHRGRVIPYTEEHLKYEKKRISKPNKLLEKFNLSLEESAEAFNNYQKNRHEERYSNGTKPVGYKHIQVNRPVPPAEIMPFDRSSAYSCLCDPNSPNPCGVDSMCLNRTMLIECHPDVCKSKEKCNNMNFQKRTYVPVRLLRTVDRGWGLVTNLFIKKGTFVIEYVGEIITHEEYRRRVIQKREEKHANYYFLYLDARRVIDAGPRGNLSRFINHSCNPNCEMVKWSVNGDARIGIFALKDIDIGEELTFNYQFDSEQLKQNCNCGAENCLGIIGRSTEKNKKKKT